MENLISNDVNSLSNNQGMKGKVRRISDPDNRRIICDNIYNLLIHKQIPKLYSLVKLLKSSYPIRSTDSYITESST